MLEVSNFMGSLQQVGIIHPALTARKCQVTRAQMIEELIDKEAVALRNNGFTIGGR